MRVCPLCLTCFDGAAEACPLDGTILDASHSGSTLIDGKYVLECRVGHGGMGAVYRARHAVLEKDFALKLIRPPTTDYASFARQFRMEAKALGKLRHPNIVSVTDYGVDPRDDGLPYLVMEHLQGETLHEHFKKKGPLSLGEFLPLLEQVAQAVDYAHQQGVLHCDLKPGNIFLSPSAGELRIAKVLDFGLARMVRPALPGPVPAAGAAGTGVLVPPSQQTTADVEIYGNTEQAETSASTSAGTQPNIVALWERPAGTPAYMPPEVIRGASPTEASDIYALGVLTYQLLVGQLPFAGSPRDIIQGHLDAAPPTPSSRGIPLAGDIEKALLAPLEKNPRQRPRCAMEMVKGIRSAYLRAARRQWLAREIPRRLTFASILALALGLLSPLLLNSGRAKELERHMVDALFAWQPQHSPDPRLLVVTIDDASLDADQTLISDRADEFGTQLERVFAAGAKGIAIDFVLPYSWSRSESFSRFVLRGASGLTLAAYAGPSGETLGTNCLAGLTASALGPNRFRSLFGFVNLEEDADGVTRRARVSFLDPIGGRWDTWAFRAACPALDPIHQAEAFRAQHEFFYIDYSADWQKMEKIPWKDLPRYLESEPAIFRDRLVLVGGDYVASGDDYHRVPAGIGSPRAVSGLMLEALIVNTILADFPVQETGRATQRFAVMLLSAAALAGALCIPRLSLFAILFVGVNALYLLAAFFLFRWSMLILPMGGPLVFGFIALGISLAIRSKLSAFPSPIKEAQCHESSL